MWTEDELKKLQRLERIYQDEQFINVKLSKFFPGKTNRQISDARRRLKPLELQPPAPAVDDIVEIPQSAEGESGSGDLAENSAPSEASQEDGWQEAITAELEKIYEVPDLWASWAFELSKQAGRALTSDSVNALYNHLIQSLSNTRLSVRIPGYGTKEIAICRKRPRKATHKLPNQTQRRRYVFAKCQEFMNKCSKKLADVVAANDLLLMQIHQAPGLRETSELYVNLWGVPGPEQNKLRQTVQTAAVGQIFSPVTPEEVSDKIKKIAITSAAGVDGLSKSDLKRKSVDVLLAKLFNILLFNEDFPSAWKINRTTLIPKAGKDVSNIKNWRPITISPMISRVFASLLDRRLQKI